MWEDRLDGVLDALIQTGDLTVEMPSGRICVYGDGTTPKVTIRMSEASLPRRFLFNPELALGEAYVDQTMTVDDDDLYGLFELAMTNRNHDHRNAAWFQKPIDLARDMMRHVQSFNLASRSRRNVAHHYDLSEKLYDLFLDADRQYSCAYYTDPDMSLEEAQTDKKRHIADKLPMKPGMTVLHIGCGWGGMSLTLARDYGAQVVGVTLSKEQHALARRRVTEAGLNDKIDIRMQDYRSVEETFDRVVSVGMFEHVGRPQFRTYFRQVHDRLKPDGIALIHTIGRMAPPRHTSPWIAKYIFPGGYVPALSEVSSAVEKERLYLADLEVWRLHYAETLLHWRKRFDAEIDAARALYDDRFCRMWRYYLIACEQTFRFGWQCVFHLQLSRQQSAVPLTRNYLYAAEDEEALAAE